MVMLKHRQLDPVSTNILLLNYICNRSKEDSGYFTKVLRVLQDAGHDYLVAKLTGRIFVVVFCIYIC